MYIEKLQNTKIQSFCLLTTGGCKVLKFNLAGTGCMENWILFFFDTWKIGFLTQEYHIMSQFETKLGFDA